MTNDEYIEEMLVEAYKHGMGGEVISRASKKMQAGMCRIDAFYVSYREVKDEEGWE